MGRLLDAVLWVTHTFHLTLRFWLGVSVLVVGGAAVGLAAAVAAYTQTPLAGAAVLVGLAVLAYSFFHSWSGILSPPVSDLRDPDYGLPSSDSVRFVAISDTHGKLTAEAAAAIPAGDVLVHGGDITYYGSREELLEFNEWLGLLPHRYKVVIAGNHDLICDSATFERNMKLLGTKMKSKVDSGTLEPGRVTFRRHDVLGEAAVRGLLSNATHYLVGQRCELEVDLASRNAGSSGGSAAHAQGGAQAAGAVRTVTVWGAPHAPPILGSAFAAFGTTPEGRRRVYSRLDEQVDVLVTHTPPAGVLDRIFSGMRVGCPELARRLVELQRSGRAPRFHVMGHIHEDRGVVKGPVSVSAGAPDFATAAVETTFINAASVNLLCALRPGSSSAIVFDV